MPIALGAVASACDDVHHTVPKKADEFVTHPTADEHPELLKPGMSLKEVEALVGRAANEPCWYYQRVGATDRVCFVGGVVSSYGTLTPEKASPQLVNVDIVFTIEPTRQGLQPPNATRVTIGAPQRRVEKLWGVPNSVDDRFTVLGQDYRGTFVGGRLTVFEPVPIPPVP
ncbi:MAG: hypothetical protein JSR24_16545 [Proteobacteria bacterium]|nr:hypothetical protein [Pseudomonadota bacterium]